MTENKKGIKVEKRYLIIGIIFIALTIIAKFPYRHYVYNNKINDLGLADFLPNFLIVLGFSFLIISFIQKKRILIFILNATFCLADELVQLLTQAIFDYKDIIAIFVALLLGILMFRFIEKKHSY